jgi:hypothetical protein
MSTFFEPMGLTQLNAYYNSMPILVEPIKVNIALDSNGKIDLDNSDCSNGFQSMAEILGNFRNPLYEPLRANYETYALGNLSYGISLTQSGIKPHTSGGQLDIEYVFDSVSGTPLESCAIIFLEYPETFKLHGHDTVTRESDTVSST